MFGLIPFKNVNHSLDLLASAHIEKNTITLSYELNGNLKKISLPKFKNKTRKIGLWETTCFEFFLLNQDDHSYYEFNFSPSGQWNCFYFKSKGAPLNEAECSLPKFKVNSENNSYKLQVEIDIDSLIDSFSNKSEFMMNLTAVIDREELSYWALDHSEDSPNFHDSNYYRKIKKVR